MLLSQLKKFYGVEVAFVLRVVVARIALRNRYAVIMQNEGSRHIELNTLGMRVQAM